jgi:hypothetical protein
LAKRESNFDRELADESIQVLVRLRLLSVGARGKKV